MFQISTAKRYKRNVAIGYSVPIAITLLTLMVELSLEKCARGKPRFGEEACFFAGIQGISNLSAVIDKNLGRRGEPMFQPWL